MKLAGNTSLEVTFITIKSIQVLSIERQEQCVALWFSVSSL